MATTCLLNLQEKKVLLETLFDLNVLTADPPAGFTADERTRFLHEDKDYDGFFENFAKIRLRGLTQSQLANELKLTVAHIKHKPALTRNDFDAQIKTRITQGTPAQQAAKAKAVTEAVMEAVMKLWLMIEPGHLNPRFEGGQIALCDCVYGTFYHNKQSASAPSYPPTQAVIDADKAELDELRAETSGENSEIQMRMSHPMTAANLSKLTRISLNFRDELNRHLLYWREDRQLEVFAHNRWLVDVEGMVRRWRAAQPATPAGPQQQRNLPPFPIPLAVLQEALKTLDLIFPRPPDEKTQTFLKKHNRPLLKFRLKPAAGPLRSEPVRFREFIHYHDRLADVAVEYLNPPRSLSIILSDKRNPLQYYTFWIGLVIFILTVAALGLGAAQVGYAVLAYNAGGGEAPEPTATTL